MSKTIKPKGTDVAKQARLIAGWLSDEGELSFDSEPGKFYRAYLVGAPPLAKHLQYGEFTLTFEMNPPFAYELPQNHDVTVTGQHPIQLKVGGTAETPVRFHHTQYGYDHNQKSCASAQNGIKRRAFIMPLSNYSKIGTINFWVRNQAVDQPGQCFVALYSTNPSGADTGTEVSGGGYARQPVTFGNPTISGDQAISQNTAVVNFPQLTASAGTAAFIALKDTESGGNLIAYASLSASLQLNAGFQPFIPIGDLRVIAT